MLDVNVQSSKISSGCVSNDTSADEIVGKNSIFKMTSGHIYIWYSVLYFPADTKLETNCGLFLSWASNILSSQRDPLPLSMKQAEPPPSGPKSSSSWPTIRIQNAPKAVFSARTRLGPFTVAAGSRPPGAVAGDFRSPPTHPSSPSNSLSHLCTPPLIAPCR